MTRPTPTQIDVAIEVLRAEAGLWERQSQRLADALTLTTAQRITGLGSAALFDDFLARYDEVVLTYAQRCTEGRDATHGIGIALDGVASTYEDEEHANVHAQHNLY
jgi:hypothetical protein